MSIGIAGQKIITGGLGINYKACEGIITTHFSLYCVDVIVPPIKPPPSGGGGGPYPGDAWNKFDSAWDLFKPVETDHYNPDKVYKVKRKIVLRVKIGNHEVEKIFMVPIQRSHVIVKVLRFADVTISRMTVAFSGIKRVWNKIGISITNIKKKKDK